MPVGESNAQTGPYRLLVGVLFAAAMVVQAPYTIDVFHSLTDGYHVPPFWLTEPWPTIVSEGRKAARAGLKNGDRIVALDGIPATSPGDVRQLIRNQALGAPVVVSVMRNGETSDHTVPVVGFRQDRWFAYLALLLLPWLSLALGFWVAVLRPKDVFAWMVLGLLLGMSQFVRPAIYDPAAWPGVVAVVTTAWRELTVRAWAICMMLFGLFFPVRSVVDKKAPWLKWLLMAPIAFSGLWDAYRESLRTQNYPAAFRIPPCPIPDAAVLTLMCLANSVFFMALSIKYRDPMLAKDERRRLRVLYWGATAGMMPYFVTAFVLPLFGIKSGDGPLLAWSLTAVILVPITLAYVIVVQRAMDVRMVLRQGVQYALARRGVLVIQLVLMAVIAEVALNYAQTHRLNPWEQALIVAAGVMAIVQVRARSEGLLRWVDRRFFREAYNSDRILSELSEQVRGILDREALLETVARKISESLHVDRVAVLLQQSGMFRPALALGYPAGEDLGVGADYRPLAELRRTREPLPLGELDCKPLDAELLLPLASRKELLGFISLGPKRSEEPYSFSDTSLLKTVAAQTGLALENSMLSEEIASEVARREILTREMEIAREVQQRLFPQNMPPVPALEYAGHCRPAQGVGGDYYDFLALANGRLGLAIADVSGKGVPAALLMASLQASTRGQLQDESGRVAELTSNVNRLVCDASPDNRYATFFYAQFNPATRRLIYTNGGHNAPILLRGDDVIRLEAGGPPVGLFRLSQYVQEEVQLLPGDLLVLYTDGISEAENATEEEWGEDALIATARQCDGLAPLETIRRIMKAADEFAAGAPQHDDMTLVIARVV